MVTWGFGIVYLALGAVLSAFLPRIARRLGTSYGREGLVDALAVYGGLHLAIGVFVILCAIYGRYEIGRLLGLLVSIGLSVIRTFSMFVHRTATNTQMILLAPEIIGAILAASALWLLSSMPGAVDQDAYAC